MSSPAAVLVAVGDELLLGATVDTNGAWLGERLSELGFRVVRRYTVADDEDEIRGAVRQGLDTGELVVVTGGLGPTDDDVTRDAVAGLLGRELELDPQILDRLEDRFRERGFDELPPANRTQARVPVGATVLANEWGTAPGLVMEEEERLVALLPGPPRELRGIFRSSLEPLLEERFRDALRSVRHRYIHTTGISESVLVDRVREHLPDDPGPVSVAFLPDEVGVDVRLTCRDLPPDEAEEALDRVEDALEPAVDGYRFHADSGDLVEALAERMSERGLTLATAESCTGGLIAQRITDRAGSSAYFLGGVVAYANDAKVEHLDVAPETLERVGAVSEEVAREMASGAARRFGADAGIGITGIAGPEGGTDEKPVGTVWYAVDVSGAVTARKGSFPGDRAQVRARSAQAALALLYRRLGSKES